MRIMGSGLKFVVLAGCFSFALVLPSEGAAIVTNRTGGPTFDSGTILGNGVASEGSRNIKAFGVEILGTQDLDFVSLETIFDNNALLFNRIISGGIYTDIGGAPGTELVSFTDVRPPPPHANRPRRCTATCSTS